MAVIIDNEGEVVDSQSGYLGERDDAIKDAMSMIDSYH